MPSSAMKVLDPERRYPVDVKHVLHLCYADLEIDPCRLGETNQETTDEHHVS